MAAVSSTQAWAAGGVVGTYNSTLVPGIASDVGVVLSTTDGGSSWVTQTLPSGVGSLTGISFVNGSDGWAASAASPLASIEGSIVATTNGGASWASDTLPAQVSLEGIDFATPSIGWAFGALPSGEWTALATTNGGANWDLQSVPPGIGLNSIDALDATHAWMAGMDCSVSGQTLAEGHILATTNGGATWTSEPIPAGLGPVSAVHFLNSTTGWAVGGSTPTNCFNGSATPGPGYLLTTTDGGARWNQQVVPAGTGALRGLSFATPSDGYAVGASAAGNGNGGQILATHDGGATWNRAGAFCNAALASVAAGDSAHLFIDPDGGPAVSTHSGASFVNGSGASASGTDCGYILTTADGSSKSFGAAPDEGSISLGTPVVGVVRNPDGSLKYVLQANGELGWNGVPPLPPIKSRAPLVGFVARTTRNGFWTVGSDGGVFAAGDAGFYGSTGNLRLNKPIVGMAATPDQKGYWLVASNGGIFSFGDATFYGSAGSLRLNKPIVGMASTPDGKGYWLVASDGGVFGFGDAGFFGSTGSIRLVKPVTAMAATPSGRGYLLAAADGGVFAFGDAAFYGSAAGTKLSGPITRIETTTPE